MRIGDLDLELEPFHTVPYANVSCSRRVVTEELPFLRATVEALPSSLDAVIVTADLQGRELCEDYTQPTRLLAERLAAEIALLRELQELPAIEKTGIIVAGDLYACPAMKRRGESGDVRPVWLTLARACRWIAGVAGNHDCLPFPAYLNRMLKPSCAYLA